MKCEHKPICLECCNNVGKCPECNEKVDPVRDKYLAESAQYFYDKTEEAKKEDEKEKKRLEEEEEIKRKTEEKKTELDQIKRVKCEVEEETRKANTRVEESDEKVRQKQNEIDTFDRDMDDTKKRLKEVNDQSEAISVDVTETAKKEEEVKREYEKVKMRQKQNSNEKENVSKAIQEDNEKLGKFAEQMNEIQAKIQNYEKRADKKETIELDLSFIGKADKMFKAIEEEEERKKQQNVGTRVVTGYIWSFWPWGGNAKERDPETIIESYEFREELGNTYTGLFRAYLKGDDDKSCIVKRVNLNRVICPNYASIKGMSAEDLSKFVEPYILHHSSNLKTNEIVKVSKYIVPECNSTPSSSYKWSRSGAQKSDYGYSFFYRYDLKFFGSNEVIDLEYLSRSGRIDPVVHGTSILEQLLKALIYLKSLKIVHRDINPENIYLSGELTKDRCPISLAGFTQAVSLTDDAIFVPLKTPTRCHPPECFRDGIISWPEVDLWSVGCSVAEVCMDGTALFTIPELSGMDVEDEEVVVKRLERMDKASEVCKTIVKMLLNPNPSKRGTLSSYLFTLNPDVTVVTAEKPAPFDRGSLERFVGSLFSDGKLPEK